MICPSWEPIKKFSGRCVLLITAESMDLFNMYMFITNILNI